jgi:hypothetical protein
LVKLDVWRGESVNGRGEAHLGTSPEAGSCSSGGMLRQCLSRHTMISRRWGVRGRA